MVPPQQSAYRGTTFTEMDTEAVSPAPGRRLIDELAHTNAPGSRNEKRVKDVEEIRAAGIDVITTVNVQHLESINDEVDGSPECASASRARRGRAHRRPDPSGRHVTGGTPAPYGARQHLRADQIDASLRRTSGSATSPPCGARLLWSPTGSTNTADYRRVHRSRRPGPPRSASSSRSPGPRERDLVAPGRLAAHRAPARTCWRCTWSSPTGCASAVDSRIARCQQLVESLGGTFHSVVGEDAPGRGGRLRHRGQRDDDHRRRLPGRPAATAVHRQAPATRSPRWPGRSTSTWSRTSEVARTAPAPVDRSRPLSRRRQLARPGSGPCCCPSC